MQQDVIGSALARLVVSQPWFASLAFRLELIERGNIPTAQTNGVSLEYNKAWFEGLPGEHQEAVLAHEVMHCALLHFTRRGHRDPMLWNMAGDHVINLELLGAGFRLPKGCLHDSRFTGLTTEEVYDQLLADGHKPDNGCGQGVIYIDPLGGVVDLQPGDLGQGNGGPDGGQPGSGATPETPDGIAVDWQIAVAVADMLGAKAGLGSPGASRACKASTAPAIDVSAILQRYFRVKEDFSWDRGNKRFISSGLYMPARVSSKLGTMAIAVDTSGSIDQGLLAQFCGIVEALVTQAGFPERLLVIYCDDRVQRVEDLHDGGIKLEAHGGGGTKFQPVFDWLVTNSVEPDVLFYLTDLDCYDRPSDPGYPVVWIAPKYVSQGPPSFGELIKVDTGRSY